MGHHPKYFGPMGGDRYAEIKALEMERKMYFSTLFIISMTLLALGIVANVIVCLVCTDVGIADLLQSCLNSSSFSWP